MTTEAGLRDEIKRLVAENEGLRSDLRVARGDEPAGEIVVRKYGSADNVKDVLWVRLGISSPEISLSGALVIDRVLARAKAEFLAHARKQGLINDD